MRLAQGPKGLVQLLRGRQGSKTSKREENVGEGEGREAGQGDPILKLPLSNTEREGMVKEVISSFHSASHSYTNRYVMSFGRSPKMSLAPVENAAI